MRQHPPYLEATKQRQFHQSLPYLQPPTRKSASTATGRAEPTSALAIPRSASSRSCRRRSRTSTTLTAPLAQKRLQSGRQHRRRERRVSSAKTARRGTGSNCQGVRLRMINWRLARRRTQAWAARGRASLGARSGECGNVGIEEAQDWRIAGEAG